MSAALSVPNVTNGLVKNDSGTLVLAGNNSTWTGTITINNGALRGDTFATSLGSASGNITVANPSAALQLAGGVSYGKSAGVVTLNSSGINTLSKFILHVRNHKVTQVVVQGSARFPWQEKSLINLQRLLPTLKLEIA